MAIKALLAKSQNSLQHLGQSLLASYPYDNFDINLKSYVPTVEKLNDSLKHLTSGLLFPLHGITLDDLKCSQELWEKSALNPQTEDPHTSHRHAWWDLLKPLHPESPGSDSKLSGQDWFNSWMFLHGLCTHGPDYFHQFRSSIQNPKSIKQIPLVKTHFCSPSHGY
ncbi:hypothetical protein EDD16DRAFT_1488216 [Pisolithus croceorrhizus]|nr:hypothetical protein EDD16DRAFT_1488216 [Pisolithus croceorrhizus]KAI6127494.1 hypothetical protein EV401DRAFT_1854502 [Pisolithus croceorrhizus]KAI6149078.1 hypothetical protein EDD17DRAFT_1493059 [Pisolithus thermaeus]